MLMWQYETEEKARWVSRGQSGGWRNMTLLYAELVNMYVRSYYEAAI